MVTARHQKILDAASAYPVVAERIRQEAPSAIAGDVQRIFAGVQPRVPSSFAWVEKQMEKRGVSEYQKPGAAEALAGAGKDAIEVGTLVGSLVSVGYVAALVIAVYAVANSGLLPAIATGVYGITKRL